LACSVVLTLGSLPMDAIPSVLPVLFSRALGLGREVACDGGEKWGDCARRARRCTYA
jgi:hypothetical protein